MIYDYLHNDIVPLQIPQRPKVTLTREIIKKRNKIKADRRPPKIIVQIFPNHKVEESVYVKPLHRPPPEYSNNGHINLLKKYS